MHRLDDDARFPAPVIYPNIASSLGILGEYAHAVVTFYGRIDLLPDAIRRVQQKLRPDDPIDRATIATLIAVLSRRLPRGPGCITSVCRHSKVQA